MHLKPVGRHFSCLNHLSTIILGNQDLKKSRENQIENQGQDIDRLVHFLNGNVRSKKIHHSRVIG